MGKQALAHLLKKGEFIWTPSATVAFEKLKEALSTPRPFYLPFEVETNASNTGIGVVLMQQGHSFSIF